MAAWLETWSPNIAAWLDAWSLFPHSMLCPHHHHSSMACLVTDGPTSPAISGGHFLL